MVREKSQEIIKEQSKSINTKWIWIMLGVSFLFSIIINIKSMNKWLNFDYVCGLILWWVLVIFWIWYLIYRSTRGKFVEDIKTNKKKVNNGLLAFAIWAIICLIANLI